MISEGMLQLGVSLWERIVHSAYQKALEIRIYLLTVLLVVVWVIKKPCILCGVMPINSLLH